MLAHFSQKGVIERVGRGLYRVAEAYSGVNLDFEELVLTASSIPRGGVCLVSALCYYNLTDQIMREYWIAIPNTDKSPKRPHIRIVRMRNMSLGLTTVKMGKYEVKIFDRERTVVDSFRYLSDELPMQFDSSALEALQQYWGRYHNLGGISGNFCEYLRRLKGRDLVICSTRLFRLDVERLECC